MFSSASQASVGRSLAGLETPCLVLETRRLARNVSRLKTHLEPFAVRFRPHLKTAKSAEVARVVTDELAAPLTVSTLREAEYFLEHGFSDLLYAIGIAPNKLEHVFDLRRRGAELSIVLDNIEMARLVAARCAERSDPLPVLIEIDTDDHRSGIKPRDPVLVEVGRALHEGGAVLGGVMTHAGSSYGLKGAAAFAERAEQERSGAIAAAEALRGAGLPCPEVSVGSTPTAHFARDLAGVTEVRAGVFMFFDLVMAGIGACSLDDIAISVLASVVGHQRDKGWILIDAGWMAMSRDRGTARLSVDQGYGIVCDLGCDPIPDLIVIDANQEHGIIAHRSGLGPLPNLPIGTMVRILPNHACATAAQHDRYHVTTDGSIVSAIWPRIYGW
ncbi:MAG: DSD1 family PLP-dependent enzyme [Bradyrhizobium sp.]|uniref:DSD1 family PLP-dependent enzyme n=1 Tax=Bradyrhizobium sp. TaxID=376 RepID=UPI001D84A7D7|nr:DSD1 family PLP-dependent enzyme [Bradyrhizobium sp.]MBV9560314.1 DSD1 family PLP-dependent enzyme [Bradyrhizobium sp.]